VYIIPPGVDGKGGGPGRMAPISPGRCRASGAMMSAAQSTSGIWPCGSQNR